VAVSADGVLHLYRGFPDTHPLVAKKRDLQAITAAALFIRREVFFEAGAFYEGYRNGFEDVELSLRIRQSGKELSCVPASRIMHLEGQSPGRYDANEHNSELLTQRCYADFFPDYHLHALRDGFTVICDDLLGLCPLLAEQEDLALRRQLIRPDKGAYVVDMDRFYQAVRENLFWLWGHETLAAILEKRKQFDEALNFRIMAFSICCTLGGAKNLLKTASITGNRKLIEIAEKYLSEIVALKTDSNHYLPVIRKNLDLAERFNDNFLRRVYEQKLAELRAGK
jgi:hypothetical protein